MLILYFIFSICVVIAHCCLIIYILHHWNNIKILSDNEKSQLGSEIGISIIIPARNEAHNIVRCIQAILDNNGINEINPQIIIIDDHSTDNTYSLVKNIISPYVNVVRLSDEKNQNEQKINAYKKAAISLGLEHCKHNFIIQLDADTIVPVDYLMTITQYQNYYSAEFLAAPIKFYPCDGLLQHFQQLDILGMMAVTGAGIVTNQWHMANGANMCYDKKHIDYNYKGAASGDDVFTIQKIAQDYHEDIHYIKDKNAIVTTTPVSTYTELYHQRIRWATKNKSMTKLSMQLMMGIPYINALFLLTYIPMMILFGEPIVLLFLFHMMTKLMVDYIYLKELTDHFDAQESMKYFLASNVMHIIYIAMIGTLSFFVKNYKWKGRTVH